MSDKITFSIEGLTIRGFFKHMYHWVPFRGEELQCQWTDCGVISAFRERQIVGNVPTEVSSIYRKWLKSGGKLRAVVVNIVPRVHRTKKEEIHVIYLFTGDATPRMTNERNLIKIAIENKRKKSLKFHNGDITDSLNWESTESLVWSAADERKTPGMEFSVYGMCARGFFKYKDVWVPEIGCHHACLVSQQKAVATTFGDNKICGHIPTDTQRLWRKFLKEGGQLTAVVAGPPKDNRIKGEEVPVTYVFKGEWTNILINLGICIEADIKKKMKTKKSLCVKIGDATSETTLKRSRTRGIEEGGDIGVSGNKKKHSSKQGTDMKPGMKRRKPLCVKSGDATCETSLKSCRKRGLVDEDTSKGKKKMKYSFKPEFGQECNKPSPMCPDLWSHVLDSDIASSDNVALECELVEDLSDQTLNKLSFVIGKDWDCLGQALGISLVTMEHIEEDYHRTSMRVYKMLLHWRDTFPDEASLGTLITKLKNLPEVTVDWDGIKNIVDNIKKSSESKLQYFRI